MLLRFMRGRMKYKFYVLLSTFSIVVLCGYFSQQIGLYPIAPVTLAPQLTVPHTNRHVSKLITVVYPYDYENDVADSVQSFVSAFPNMPVLVLCETTPYPPFTFSSTNESMRNVKILSQELKLENLPDLMNPLKYIKTEFTLIVPDVTRVITRKMVQHAVTVAFDTTNIIAIGLQGSRLECLLLKWVYQDWTIRYSKSPKAKLCEAVLGHHAILIRTQILHQLPEPFALPFPEALYIQTAVKNYKVQILDSVFGVSHRLQQTPGMRQHMSRYVRDRRLAFFKRLGVKAVVKDDGRVSWFGCKKETQRCYPPVQGVPSYILSGRNTPPCCRRNIRRTVIHVLHALAVAGVRCWLETTTLLGAVIRRDILPYAEHAEIGIHAADVSQAVRLVRGGTDAEGYVWERATRGRYYTVSYSSTNAAQVLLLPFVPRNGTMWPLDWVLAHQKEFPERHLHPLAQITFGNRQAPAPNDALAFLDLKLGVNSVERSKKIGHKLIYP